MSDELYIRKYKAVTPNAMLPKTDDEEHIKIWMKAFNYFQTHMNSFLEKLCCPTVKCLAKNAYELMFDTYQQRAVWENEAFDCQQYGSVPGQTICAKAEKEKQLYSERLAKIKTQILVCLGLTMP